MIAPLVAAREPSVMFIVLLAGPGLRGAEILVSQIVDDATAEGWNDSRIAQDPALLHNILAAIATPPSSSQAAALALEIMQASKDIHGFSDAHMVTMAEILTSNWIRFFLSYDPVPALNQVKLPVLAINGAKDIQVAAKPNLAAIYNALAENRDVETEELAGLNHLFQTANTGRASEYGEIEETFAPRALDLISKWIALRAR